MEEELEFIIESTKESMSNAINHLEKKLITHYINKISIILNFELSAITSCLIE